MHKYLIILNGKAVEATVLRKKGSTITFSVNGSEYTVNVAPLLGASTKGVSSTVDSSDPTTPSASHLDDSRIVAPMPGIIVSVAVEKGDNVKNGEALLVMVAMEMENNIISPRGGTVKAVHVKVGDEAENEQLLVELE